MKGQVKLDLQDYHDLIDGSSILIIEKVEDKLKENGYYLLHASSHTSIYVCTYDACISHLQSKNERLNDLITKLEKEIRDLQDRPKPTLWEKIKFLFS